MKKENKILLVLFAVAALVNLGLAGVLWFSCRVMAGIYQHLFGELPSNTALVLKVQWWPWLLFVAAGVCTVATTLGFIDYLYLINTKIFKIQAL